jgi:hypothetical protein
VRGTRRGIALTITFTVKAPEMSSQAAKCPQLAIFTQPARSERLCQIYSWKVSGRVLLLHQMALGKRIFWHGLLAAVPLALIGYLFAHMAGMWTAAQSPMRIGPLHEESVVAKNPDADAITQALQWKVPLTLATGGFLFVVLGELLLSLWRPRPGQTVNAKDAGSALDIATFASMTPSSSLAKRL